MQIVLPRRHAVLPLLVAGCYMTLGQTLSIWGLDFYLTRIVILAGLVRITFRGELFEIRWNATDGILLAWLSACSFLYMLLDGTNSTLTQRLGYAYDVVGTYLLVRSTVRTVDDMVGVARVLAVLVIPLSLLFVVESMTGRNPFAVFGGVDVWSEIRDGRIRSRGPFLHPISAGTFGATSMALFVGLWVSSRHDRILASAAIVAASTIVVASASSGPVSAYAVAIAGLACWPIRSYMRVMRWLILIAIVALALVMKEPVWFLIARVSDLTGGGGWYRSALIDAAVRHFDEWWLIGTGYTAHWMATGLAANENSADIVNEFISQGVRGGILTLVLYIWMIARSFRAVGVAVQDTTKYSASVRFFVWSLGATLVAHVASFFSVSYFDQMTVYWFLLIGMTTSLASQTQRVSSPIRRPRFHPNQDTRTAPISTGRGRQVARNPRQHAVGRQQPRRIP
jgi:hypothetical protein